MDGVGWNQFVDAFMPLDDRITGDPALRFDDFFPRLTEAAQWNGRTYVLPSSGQVAVVYYNKDLFDEAGLAYPTADWTWDDMVRMAEALTHDYDGDGLIDQYGVQLGQVYQAPFLLYDGQVADPEWKTARIDTPVTRGLMRRYRALMYGGEADAPFSPVMPTPTASQELGMLPMFEAGRVAMHASSGYAIETFREVKFDWDAVTFPWYEYKGSATGRPGCGQRSLPLHGTPTSPMKLGTLPSSV